MTDYLIWSNQHCMWWRPNERGYTDSIEEAGRYPHSYATRIVATASVDGQLLFDRTDPVTGRQYRQAPEVMVPAPQAEQDVDGPTSTARFGIVVDSDNGVHVRFRIFAATGGQHLGECGRLVMRTDEFAAFRDLVITEACQACPAGCPECSKDEATCECYQHAAQHPDEQEARVDRG